MNILKLFSMVMLAGAAYGLFESLILPQWQAQHTPAPSRDIRPMPRTMTTPMANSMDTPATITSSAATPTDCQGHTHCSAMHSCDEAKYWLSRCTDAEMDGDGDGIPCERQLCQTALH